MIVCGWCHAETQLLICGLCGRKPEVPWVQRGLEPPRVKEWQEADFRRRVEDVRRQQPDLSDERIAELVGVSPRTFRRRLSADGRAVTSFADPDDVRM